MARGNPVSLNPALLRHRVQVQEDQGATVDAHGQPVPGWVTVRECWARVENLTGQELFFAQQQTAVADVRVTVRYWADLTTKHRFMHGTRELNIVSVADLDGLKVHQECLCKAAG